MRGRKKGRRQSRGGSVPKEVTNLFLDLTVFLFSF